MKKFAIILVILSLLVGSCPVFAAPAENDPSVLTGCSSLLARLSLGGSGQKLDTAKAAILYELNSDTMVYSWNPDAIIDPTGLVKLLTVLVALELGDLHAQVTVSREALNSVAIGAVSANLKRGEILTLEELLYCVMVASANDACAVIAEYIGGSQAGFVELMNQKARDLGCTSSNFTNPHGLPDENQFSTARDMAILTEAALENEVFNTMFCAKEHTVPATNVSEPRELNTTNHMMSSATVKNYVDSRVTGGKPAAATTTDRSMVCTAEVGTSRYLCLVMSATGVVSEDGYSVVSYGCFEETKVLLDYGFYNFEVRQVIDKSQIFAQYNVAGGENDVVLQPDRDLYTVLPKEYEADELLVSEQVSAGTLNAPVKQGDVLGALRVSYGSVVLGSCDLVAMYDVAAQGSTIRPAEPAQPDQEEAGLDLSFLKWVGLGLGGLLVLTVAVFVGIRLVRSSRIRRMHRRRMRQRRRSR